MLSGVSCSGTKKKDKKLVFLSRTVLEKVKKKPMTTGTQIANEILDLYRQFCERVDFKNVQRRVYDALNVLSALDIIRKDKSHIIYNQDNEHIDKHSFAESPSPLMTPVKSEATSAQLVNHQPLP